MGRKKIDNKTAFSKYLNDIFSQRGDQREVARTAGVHEGTVSQWFSGRGLPNPDQLEKIINEFDMHPVETYCLAYGEETAVARIRLIAPQTGEPAEDIGEQMISLGMVRRWD